MTTHILEQERGVGLVEALIAVLITSVVITGSAVLVLYGVRLQKLSGDRTNGRGVASQQLERLRVLPRTAAEKQFGGNLATNVANYFSAATPGFTTRWVVTAGPAGSKNVTVAAVPATPSEPTVQVQARIWP